MVVVGKAKIKLIFRIGLELLLEFHLQIQGVDSIPYQNKGGQKEEKEERET